MALFSLSSCCTCVRVYARVHSCVCACVQRAINDVPVNALDAADWVSVVEEVIFLSIVCTFSSSGVGSPTSQPGQPRVSASAPASVSEPPAKKEEGSSSLADGDAAVDGLQGDLTVCSNTLLRLLPTIARASPTLFSRVWTRALQLFSEVHAGTNDGAHRGAAPLVALQLVRAAKASGCLPPPEWTPTVHTMTALCPGVDWSAE